MGRIRYIAPFRDIAFAVVVGVGVRPGANIHHGRLIAGLHKRAVIVAGPRPFDCPLFQTDRKPPYRPACSGPTCDLATSQVGTDHRCSFSRAEFDAVLAIVRIYNRLGLLPPLAFGLHSPDGSLGEMDLVPAVALERGWYESSCHFLV